MMYRPEGKEWGTKRTNYLTNGDNSFLGCSREAKGIYEAGADAMLEGLKKSGKKMGDDGYLVFIPKEPTLHNNFT